MRAASTQARLKLVLSIESALGVLNAYDMATAAARVVSLTFGGAQDGDLNTDLGCAWSIDGPEMLHARATRCWPRAPRGSTARSTACSPMCATPRASSATPRSRAGSATAGASSFIPSQIEPCNRLYRPSAAELDYYARVLEAFDQAVAQGSASTTVDGNMIDVAMANAARRVLDAEAAWKKAG